MYVTSAIEHSTIVELSTLDGMDVQRSTNTLLIFCPRHPFQLERRREKQLSSPPPDGSFAHLLGFFLATSGDEPYRWGTRPATEETRSKTC